jgi:hypothetical protein
MSQNLNSAVAVIGIDIGKNSFHVVGLDDRGAIVLRQKWSRWQIEARLANMPPCLIGMEACVGAHHLSRKLKALGQDARLMPAKYVRPYSKGQKNDFRDAEAIAEAVQRPTMKFVATKTAEQLDLQALRRVRERLVSQRTGVINQIRAFLLERGIAVRQGLRFLRAELPRILATPSDVLSPRMVRVIRDLAEDWRRGRFKLGVTARGTPNPSGGGPSLRLNENRGDGFVPALPSLGRFFGWRWWHHVPGVSHVLPVPAVLDDDAHVGAHKVLVASIGRPRADLPDRLGVQHPRLRDRQHQIIDFLLHKPIEKLADFARADDRLRSALRQQRGVAGVECSNTSRVVLVVGSDPTVVDALRDGFSVVGLGRAAKQHQRQK